MPELRELRTNFWLHEATVSGISVRGAVIIGERFSAVWDSLSHPTDVAALSDVLGEKPYYLVYSHADWDHCWGTAGLARQPLAVAAHFACRRRFDQELPEALNRVQMAEPGQWGAVRLVPPNLMFNTALTLDLGGLTLELHHLPGHTEDSIVGWIPQWGILLGGDAIETPLPVVNSASGIDDWLARLESWAARPDVWQTVSSHGAYDGREALERTVAYLRALSGDRDFVLPPALDSFYTEAHRKNLALVAGERDADAANTA